MVTASNPLNLTDDQKVQLDLILIRLAGAEVISFRQRDQIIDAVLGIQMTPEEEEYERRNTSSADQQVRHEAK